MKNCFADINNCNYFQYFVTERYTIFSSRLTTYHAEVLIMACISFTVTLLKSFEVDSSHMPLSSQVKSNAIKSMVVDLGSFLPQVGSHFYSAAIRRSNWVKVRDRFRHMVRVKVRVRVRVRLKKMNWPVAVVSNVVFTVTHKKYTD